MDEECETLTIPRFCALVGISRTFGYKLAAENRLPVPVIRVGKKLLVSRRAVQEFLELGTDRQVGTRADQRQSIVKPGRNA